MQPEFSADEIQAAARGFGLDPDPKELESMDGVVAELLADYEVLDRAPAEPAVPARPGGRPDNDQNPFFGWSWVGQVESASNGPLAGVEVAIKDTVSLAGTPMLNGSAFLEGFVSEVDATIVTRLIEAGATIRGKTAVPAFCFEGAGITGYPEPFPVNPRDPGRMPGASSSGSAVLVAAGVVDHAIGGDQGGSIRIPASWCGCVGHKPTFGLVPYTGVFPIEMTLDSVGPMGKDVTAVARLLEVLAGPDGLDPRQTGGERGYRLASLGDDPSGLKVGLLEEGFGIGDTPRPDVDEAVRAAADGLTDLGIKLSEVSVPDHHDGVAIWNLICIQGATELFESAGLHSNRRGLYPVDIGRFMAGHRDRADLLPDTLKATLVAGRLVTDRYGLEPYARAQNQALGLRQAYDRALEEVDVLVMPTTPMTAPPLPDLSQAGETETIVEAIGLDSARNVAPFNVSGHPSISIPCGQDEQGLPIGLMVVGRWYEDATVLRVARAIEKIAEKRVS
ncbi:MAG: amidase [Solirubrobacterales bacterium]|nr:amidase [Solirubrobacterales bacterium]OJU95918.1 MAG: hypothetical protein BGO23_10095 [Solirubrobacterales bacterium 67-14]